SFEMARAQAIYNLLVDRDLDFDLRRGSPFQSNLCEENAALELAYTFGGRERCGLRYSFEPTCRRGVLKNRYDLFRDRMQAAMQRLGAGYDSTTLHRAFRVAVPRELLLRSDNTVTILAAHHYRDRRPRLKAYFSCDYSDPVRSRRVVRDLIGVLEDRTLNEQTRRFFGFFKRGSGARMVGLDFEPGCPVAAKVYLQGAGLSQRRLDELIAYVGGGADARAGLDLFRDRFLDGDRRPAAFNLVSLGLDRGGDLRLKLYIRPVEFYPDGEALGRLRNWYRAIDRQDELAAAEVGLAATTPLDLLDRTRGFFNYLSVDVGATGVSKTSIYFVPQIPLGRLAREDPERLDRLLDAGPRLA
ncbi:MAG: hypothetical protein JXR83_13830, partial [Deltaproteobacteria bacterium]|nr:hypothetical protein [Deltaproteobacteria bacterium]